MTWCVAEAHRLSVTQVFQLQGCNVAHFCLERFFPDCSARGSASVHVGGSSERNDAFLGAEVSTQHARICWWRRDMKLVYLYIDQH